MKFQSRHTGWIRILSVLIVMAFLAQDLSYAIGDVKWAQQNSSQSISVPPHDGIARKLSGHGRDLIINLQDAHQKLGAQESIARLLDHLVSHYDLRVIGLEGASQPVDTSVLSSLPDDELKKKTGEYLLREGLISAGEFYSIISKNKVGLYGVEEEALYRENLEVFKKLVDAKKDIRRELKALRLALKTLEEKINNPNLKALAAHRLQYLNGEMKIGEYWDYFGALAANRGVDLLKYPNLGRIIRTVSLEKKIDFGGASAERENLVKRLTSVLPKDQTEKLIQSMLEYKQEKITAADFYGRLIFWARQESVDAATYENLRAYSSYLEAYESIDLISIFEEARKFEDQIRETLFIRPEERALAQISESAAILSRLLDVTLNAADYELIQKQLSALDLAVMNKKISGLFSQCHAEWPARVDFEFLAGRLPDAEKFYELASRRNKVLLANTLERMRRENVHVAALVTGGFHSEGISKLVEDEKVSCLVVMPRFDAKSPDRPYISVLTRKPKEYENFFKDSDFYIAGEALFTPQRFMDFGLDRMVALVAAFGAGHFLGSVKSRREFTAKAIRAARRAMRGNGSQAVSLNLWAKKLKSVGRPFRSGNAYLVPIGSRTWRVPVDAETHEINANPEEVADADNLLERREQIVFQKNGAAATASDVSLFINEQQTRNSLGMDHQNIEYQLARFERIKHLLFSPAQKQAIYERLSQQFVAGQKSAAEVRPSVSHKFTPSLAPVLPDRSISAARLAEVSQESKTPPVSKPSFAAENALWLLPFVTAVSALFFVQPVFYVPFTMAMVGILGGGIFLAAPSVFSGKLAKNILANQLVLYCGIWGLFGSYRNHLLNGADPREAHYSKKLRSIVRAYVRMLTERGHHGAGIAIMVKDIRTGMRSFELLKLPNSSGTNPFTFRRQAGPQLTESVNNAFEAQIEKLKRSGKEIYDIMLLGHVRLSTSAGKQTPQNTQPFHIGKGRSERVSRMHDGSLTTLEEGDECVFAANGDLVEIQIFREESPVGYKQLRELCMRLYKTDIGTNDSEAAGYLLYLMKTQGMWRKSLIKAYLRGIMRNIKDEIPSETGEFSRWAGICEEIYGSAQVQSALYAPGADSVEAIRGDGQGRALFLRLARERFKSDSYWSSYPEAVKKLPLFLEEAFESFISGNPYSAAKEMMPLVSVDSTYGAEAIFTTDPKNYTIISRQQPVSIVRNQTQNIGLLGSSSTTAKDIMMRYTSLQDDQVDLFRLSPKTNEDGWGGEIVQLDMSDLRHMKVYSMLENRELAPAEIDARYESQNNNRYNAPILSSHIEGIEDPIEADQKILPLIAKTGDERWENPESFSRQTFGVFFESLKRLVELRESGAPERHAEDLIILSFREDVEKAKYFANLMKYAFPLLRVKVMQANEYLHDVNAVSMDEHTVSFILDPPGSTYPLIRAVDDLVAAERRSKPEAAEFTEPSSPPDDSHSWNLLKKIRQRHGGPVFIQANRVEGDTQAALGQGYKPDSPFIRRIFTTDFVPAIDGSAAEAAAHLWEIERIAMELMKSMREAYPAGAPLGLTLSLADIAKCREVVRRQMHDKVKLVVGMDFRRDHQPLAIDRAMEYKSLMTFSNTISPYLLDVAKPLVASISHLWLSILSGGSLISLGMFTLSYFGFKFDDPFIFITLFKSPLTYLVLLPFLVLEAARYQWFSYAYTWRLRRKEGREPAERTGTRSMTFTDPNWNRTLANISRDRYGLSSGFTDPFIQHASQEIDVDDLASTVRRGSLIFMYVPAPDDQSALVSRSVAASSKSANIVQAIQSYRRVGAHVVAIGNHPDMKDLGFDHFVSIWDSATQNYHDSLKFDDPRNARALLYYLAEVPMSFIAQSVVYSWKTPENVSEHKSFGLFNFFRWNRQASQNSSVATTQSPLPAPVSEENTMGPQALDRMRQTLEQEHQRKAVLAPAASEVTYPAVIIHFSEPDGKVKVVFPGNKRVVFEVDGAPGIYTSSTLRMVPELLDNVPHLIITGDLSRHLHGFDDDDELMVALEGNHIAPQVREIFMPFLGAGARLASEDIEEIGPGIFKRRKQIAFEPAPEAITPARPAVWKRKKASSEPPVNEPSVLSKTSYPDKPNLFSVPKKPSRWSLAGYFSWIPAGIFLTLLAYPLPFVKRIIFSYRFWIATSFLGAVGMIHQYREEIADAYQKNRPTLNLIQNWFQPSPVQPPAVVDSPAPVVDHGPRIEQLKIDLESKRGDLESALKVLKEKQNDEQALRTTISEQAEQVEPLSAQLAKLQKELPKAQERLARDQQAVFRNTSRLNSLSADLASARENLKSINLNTLQTRADFFSAGVARYLKEDGTIQALSEKDFENISFVEGAFAYPAAVNGKIQNRPVEFTSRGLEKFKSFFSAGLAKRRLRDARQKTELGRASASTRALLSANAANAGYSAQLRDFGVASPIRYELQNFYSGRKPRPRNQWSEIVKVDTPYFRLTAEHPAHARPLKTYGRSEASREQLRKAGVTVDTRGGYWMSVAGSSDMAPLDPDELVAILISPDTRQPALYSIHLGEKALAAAGKALSRDEENFRAAENRLGILAKEIAAGETEAKKQRELYDRLFQEVGQLDIKVEDAAARVFRAKDSVSADRPLINRLTGEIAAIERSLNNLHEEIARNEKQVLPEKIVLREAAQRLADELSEEIKSINETLESLAQEMKKTPQAEENKEEAKAEVKDEERAKEGAIFREPQEAGLDLPDLKMLVRKLNQAKTSARQAAKVQNLDDFESARDRFNAALEALTAAEKTMPKGYQLVNLHRAVQSVETSEKMFHTMNPSAARLAVSSRYILAVAVPRRQSVKEFARQQGRHFFRALGPAASRFKIHYIPEGNRQFSRFSRDPRTVAFLDATSLEESTVDFLLHKLSQMDRRSFSVLFPFIDVILNHPDRISRLTLDQKQFLAALIEKNLPGVAPRRILVAAGIASLQSEVITNAISDESRSARALASAMDRALAESLLSDKNAAASFQNVASATTAFLSPSSPEDTVSVSRKADLLAGQLGRQQRARYAKADPSYRLDLSRVIAAKGASQKTMVTDLAVFLKDGAGKPWSYRMENLKRKAGDLFDHVLWVSDPSITNKEELLARHPEAGIFGNNLIFAPAAKTLEQIYQARGSVVIQPEFIVLTAKPDPMETGKPLEGVKQAMALSLDTKSESTIRFLETAALLILKPDQLPAYVFRMPGGSLVFRLPAIVPLDYRLENERAMQFAETAA